MSDFTHFDDSGNSHMVDISSKDTTSRSAIAKGFVRMSSETIDKIKNNEFKKGDVLSVAQLAGIMGAKKTPDLIPLCHPISLDSVSVILNLADNGVKIEATCKVGGKTGVEMEALTAVSVSALTVYDMCKSVDKSIKIEDIRLTYKDGGKSGKFQQK
ncbi:MAG: cyclic pyranopterin monophosphate synthase MoaC [Alphaproteobacteria bacterium]